MDQFNLLRLFVAIADQGSLSAVAKARAISPSTVTLGLQSLETRIGVRLVTRTTRRLSLTPEGERFVVHCRRILADLDDVMDGATDHGPLQGEIRVTAVNDFGRNRLIPLVDDFMLLHPAVKVSLMLTDTVLDLAESGYDIGIRTGALPADPRLAVRLLIHGRRQVCAAPDYWHRTGKPVHPRDLARHNCLVLDRPGAPQRNWNFTEEGRAFTVRVDGNRAANDGGILRKWAIEGIGVVLKSSFDVAEDLATGRLETALDGFSIEGMNLFAVHPADRQPSRRISAFVDYLEDRLSSAHSGAKHR